MIEELKYLTVGPDEILVLKPTRRISVEEAGRLIDQCKQAGLRAVVFDESIEVVSKQKA